MNQVVKVVVCFVFTVKVKLGFVFIQVTPEKRKKFKVHLTLIRCAHVHVTFKSELANLEANFV